MAPRILNAIPYWKSTSSCPLSDELRCRVLSVPGIKWSSSDGGLNKTPTHEPFAVRGVVDWDRVFFKCCFCLNKHSKTLEKVTHQSEIVEAEDLCHVVKGKVFVVADKMTSSVDMEYALQDPALPLSPQTFESLKHAFVRRRINSLGPYSDWVHFKLDNS